MLVHVADKSEGRAPRTRARARRRASESLRELRELARTAGTDVADVVLQVRERIDPKFVLGTRQARRGHRPRHAARRRDAHLRPRPHPRAGRRAREGERPQGHRPHAAHPRHLRAARREPRRQAPGRARAAQVQPAAPRRRRTTRSRASPAASAVAARARRSSRSAAAARRSASRTCEAQLKELGKRRAAAAEAAHATARPDRRASSATPTPARARSSTRSPAPTSSPRTSSSRRSTRARVTLKVGWAGYGGREVVLTDTVGFIRDLPKDLFAAFRATFEEAADADLLLHVLDAGDPARELHRATTLALLEDLELVGDPAHHRLQQGGPARALRAAAAPASRPGRRAALCDGSRDDARAHRGRGDRAGRALGRERERAGRRGCGGGGRARAFTGG